MALSPTLRFRRLKGINNVDDPVRLHEGNKVSGLTSLVEAENVDIDSKRMLSRRKGFLAPTVAGNIYSIWSNENEDICLYMQGGGLRQLFSDGTNQGLGGGWGIGLPASYVEINDIVVISTTQQIRFFRDGRLYDLETLKSPLVGQRPVTPKPKGKSLPVSGHLIEIFQNRLLVASGSNIFFSDAMMIYDFDRERNYHQFHGVISMIKAVSDGVYVSDSKNTYFLAGGDFQKAKLKIVADYMAFGDTAIELEGEELGLDGYEGTVIMWASEKGICVGAEGGRFANITKLVYSPGSTWKEGTGLFRKDKKQYIVSLHN